MCYIDGQKNKYSALNECNRTLKYNIEVEDKSSSSVEILASLKVCYLCLVSPIWLGTMSSGAVARRDSVSHSHSAGQTEICMSGAGRAVADPRLSVYLSGTALNSPQPRETEWRSAALISQCFNRLLLQTQITVAARSKARNAFAS
jgi:hypothetical protein